MPDRLVASDPNDGRRPPLGDRGDDYAKAFFGSRHPGIVKWFVDEV